METYRQVSVLRIIFALMICALLLGGVTEKVNAATCTWTGNTSTKWMTSSNWSCGHVPTGADDVVIPNVTNDPLIDTDHLVANANNMTIETGASIAVSEQLTLNATNVDNYGTVKTIGNMDSTWVRIYAPFNNYGVLDSYCGGSISLYNGGNHTGTFTGQFGSILFIHDQVHDTVFSTTASILVRKVSFLFFTTGITVPASVHQVFAGSSFTVDMSHVTLTNLTNFKLGAFYNSDGSLILAFTGTTTGSVDVPNGASLTGAGTITGDVSNAGIISPGASPGVINVDGSYEQSPDGALDMEIGGTTAGTDYDQLLITGAATLDGRLEVTLIDDFQPALGDSFNIMTFTSRIDEFVTVTMPDLAAGLGWIVAYSSTDVTLEVVRSGSISGTVTYTGTKGTNPIVMAVFLDYEDAPVDVVNVGSGTTQYDYAFEGVPMGDYYLAALMDLNSSDDPDPDEPYNFYDANDDGEPDMISVSDTTWVFSDVDFDLEDPPMFKLFLPLIIR